MSVHFESVTIANGAAVSSAFPFNGRRIVGIIGDTAWTAADFSFEVQAPTSGSWVKVVNRTGSLHKLTGVNASASEYQMLGGDASSTTMLITGPGDGRVVSTNTASEADANQGAARTLVVVLDG